MSAVGCMGWLVNTARPDIAYAHSRIAQHMANPTESAWKAVIHLCQYVSATKNFTISCPLYSEDQDLRKLSSFSDSYQDYGFEFFSDTDHSGNSETQNKRRSQNGCIVTQSKATVMWTSKVSSVAFAHPDIGESHSDMSSAAAEIYGAANATMDILHLSYIADELGIEFPKPIRLQIDNTAAKAFCDNSVYKTNLKHIDCRQHWVRTLRDKNILHPVYVPTKENIADLFTKILPRLTFQYLRDKIMSPFSG